MHYDENGNKLGLSDSNIRGGFNHNDEHGRRIGSSETLPGDYVHFGCGSGVCTTVGTLCRGNGCVLN